MNQLLVGSIIDGKYEVLSMLGSGGLGAVYQASQAELSRTVAIKVLHGRQTDNESRARFEREARVLSAMQHEHIVGIYSFGFLTDGFPYMTMEYLSGKTLGQVIEAETRLEWRRVVKLGIQICQALQTAHGHGVIHRDLKPQNILLIDKPEPDFVKVLDFGLSRLVPEAELEVQKLTQTGALIGSVHYMSPELCAGLQADERSDIYSLGCLLYECLAGNPPLDSWNAIGILHMHRSQLPAPLTSLPQTRDVPKALEKIVFKALQKEAADRFQNMKEFEAALKLLNEGRENEIALANVSLGTAPAKKAPPIALMAACAVGLIVVTLVLLKMSPTGKKHKSATAQAAISAVTATRWSDIERARKSTDRALEYKNDGNTRSTILNIRQALDAIGRNYAPDACHDEKCSLAVVGILEDLGRAAQGLELDSTSIRVQLGHTDDTNRAALSRAQDRNRLFLSEARLYVSAREMLDAASRYQQAINTALEFDVKHGRNILEEARESSDLVTTFKSPTASIFLDVAEEHLLIAEGKLAQAKQMEEDIDKNMNEVLSERVKTHCDLEIDLYCLAQARHDIPAARKLLHKCITMNTELIGLMPGINTFEQTFEKTAGRSDVDHMYDTALLRMRNITINSSIPELKEEAQKAWDEMKAAKAKAAAEQKSR